MSTLSNVGIEQGCTDSKGTGVESFTLPCVRHSQTGVSVEYVPDPTKERRWYVFRATFNKTVQVADRLIEHGIYTYVATKEAVVRQKSGKILTKLVPLINLVFAFVTSAEAEEFVRGRNMIPNLTYYYNHFEQNGLLNPPLTVDDQSMRNFILATKSHNRHVRLLSKEELQNRIGEEVRITYGEFEGVRGRLARIAGQQRVVIDVLDGMFVATAYVPTAFLEFCEPTA